MVLPEWFVDLHPGGLAQAEGARTLVMGIVNVTPDSFSDGGRWAGPDAAVARGLHLHALGADLVDVGGESTRPGAKRVDEAEEMLRVIPVVRELADRGVAVSIDTMRAGVAAAAVEAGALVVNDVSGGLADPEMASTVAALRVGGRQPLYVAMHWRAHSPDMDAHDRYHDVVADVRCELQARLEALCGDGVQRERIIVDPGLGFAKAGENNWPLLRDLGALQSLGCPVLIGASRKRFLSGVSAGEGPTARDAATAAVTAIVAARGVWAVRVHEVEANVAAVRVAALAGVAP
ncbi:dihydropteroate synthase [Micrococcales bacterium 31B]|nr:dihydropteroate synthase [Micrococcales bacterium 31B]